MTDLSSREYLSKYFDPSFRLGSKNIPQATVHIAVVGFLEKNLLIP